MKRASILIALLLVVVAGAFALDATVTWSWSQNDPDVKYFRYQLDGEEEDKWTVVDADVLSASYDIDVSVEHILYLQQSYDGANWSASSHTVSAAVEDETLQAAAAEVPETAETTEVPVEGSEPAAEPAAEPASETGVEVSETASETKDEEVQPEAPVEEPAVQEAPVAEVSAEEAPKAAPAVYPAKSRIDLGAVYGNTIPFDANAHLVGASLGYTFLFGRTGSFGFGAKIQAAAYTGLDTFNDLKNISVDAFKGTLDLMLVADYAASWMNIYLGVGGEIAAQLNALKSYTAGVVAQLGARFKLGDVFGVGLEVTDCYSLYPEASKGKNAISAKAYLSFEF
mgnify:FL=1